MLHDSLQRSHGSSDGPACARHLSGRLFPQPRNFMHYDKYSAADRAGHNPVSSDSPDINHPENTTNVGNTPKCTVDHLQTPHFSVTKSCARAVAHRSHPTQVRARAVYCRSPPGKYVRKSCGMQIPPGNKHDLYSSEIRTNQGSVRPERPRKKRIGDLTYLT